MYFCFHTQKYDVQALTRKQKKNYLNRIYATHLNIFNY